MSGSRPARATDGWEVSVSETLAEAFVGIKLNRLVQHSLDTVLVSSGTESSLSFQGDSHKLRRIRGYKLLIRWLSLSALRTGTLKARELQ
jgi:hypothetical protein